MMETDNKKICPNCGGEMVGASCPYCHYVDKDYKASAVDTLRLGRKVIDEQFDVAYPEYFTKVFDLMAERTTYKFKYKYVLEVGNQRILIEATLINSLTLGQPSRYTSQISSTTVSHTIPPMAFLVGSRKFVNQDKRPIAFKEWGMFCVGDITMLQFSDKQLRDFTVSETAIKGLQMFTRAFYEAVIGDGTYTEELEDLIRYNSINSQLIEEEIDAKDKIQKDKDKRLAENEQKKKEEETEKLWEKVRSVRTEIGGDIGMAYLCVIFSCVPILAPLMFLFYGTDNEVVTISCLLLIAVGILALYFSISYLKKGLRKKEDFKQNYPQFKDRDNGYLGVSLLVIILVASVIASCCIISNGIHQRKVQQEWELIQQTNESIIKNIITKELIGKTYSYTPFRSNDKMVLRFIDAETLQLNGETYPYTLDIRGKYSEDKTCNVKFSGYCSNNIISTIKKKSVNGVLDADSTTVELNNRITLTDNNDKSFYNKSYDFHLQH